MQMFSIRYTFLSLFIFLVMSCQSKLPAQVTPAHKTTEKLEDESHKSIIVGAERIAELKEILKNKRVGIVGNQTSMVGATHLVDTLLSEGVQVIKIFSPEHGFRGDADAGEHVASNVDARTGLPIVSIYGDNKKPKAEQLKGLDVLVLDLQDVGARFYTYISTLHYIMEAAAENNLSVLVLDRPNPNGHYVDGPIRKEGFVSFIGMQPIPVVHGMTIAEIAQMINGEGWLDKKVKCNLSVLSCLNYERTMKYSLPVSPSPNLRSDEAIALYPSLCFFEGTDVSVGRGTPTPFEIYGHPTMKGQAGFDYTFKPVSSFGAKQPLLENQQCYGENLHEYAEKNEIHQLEIKWLIAAYKAMGSKESFFSRKRFFDLLAGTDELRIQISAGKTEQEIRASWEEGLDNFKQTRAQYLLYK